MRQVGLSKMGKLDGRVKEEVLREVNIQDILKSVKDVHYNQGSSLA